MEFREVVEKRRSIRRFKKDDIANEVIEDIIDCGRLAPSAKNRQPWYFVVIRNKEKDAIVHIMLILKSMKSILDIKVVFLELVEL